MTYHWEQGREGEYILNIYLCSQLWKGFPYSSCNQPRPPSCGVFLVVQAIIKPQYVDHIPKAVKGKVGDIFTSKNQLGTMESVLTEVSVVPASGENFYGSRGTDRRPAAINRRGESVCVRTSLIDSPG